MRLAGRLYLRFSPGGKISTTEPPVLAKTQGRELAQPGHFDGSLFMDAKEVSGIDGSHERFKVF